MNANINETTLWQLDTHHSAANFSIRHMMISQVRGNIPGLEGSVAFADGRPTALDMTLNLAALDTGVADRDAHLKGPDFFDLEQHPVATFTSAQVETGDQGFVLKGTLTIKGVVREITVPLTGFDQDWVDPWGNTRRGGTAAFRVDRRDFGLDWNAPLDNGGLLIGHEVDILVDIEAIRPA